MRRRAAVPAIAAAITLAACAKHGPRVFVTNERAGTVTVIDSGSDRVVATIPLGSRARGVAVHGDRLYVGLTDHGTRLPSAFAGIAEVRLKRGYPTRRLPAGTDPEGLAIAPNGRIFVANEDAGAASIVDPDDGKAPATLLVGIEPEGVAVSPDGKWAFVTAETSNTVSVIDAARGEVVGNILVAARPRAAAFTPDSKRAYVTSELAGAVSVIDVARREVLRRLDLAPPSHPVGVAVSPDGARVYVATGRGNSVAVLDTDGTLLSTIPVGQRPWGIALCCGGRKLYTADGPDDAVSVVDTAAGRVVATVKSGGGPWGVAAE